jgi:hypothetical protein
MNISVAQMRITRDLRQAEDSLDDALLKQAKLLTTLITARRETGTESFVGQIELMRLVKSQQTLLSAAGDLARVHGGLKEIGRERAGIVHDCPPNKPMGVTGEEPDDDSTIALDLLAA